MVADAASLFCCADFRVTLLRTIQTAQLYTRSPQLLIISACRTRGLLRLSFVGPQPSEQPLTKAEQLVNTAEACTLVTAGLGSQRASAGHRPFSVQSAALRQPAWKCQPTEYCSLLGSAAASVQVSAADRGTAAHAALQQQTPELPTA